MSPSRIAVRLPNWLGDTVMAVPALRALRDAFPDAQLVAAGPWVSILAGQGLTDRLYTYPRAWSGRLRAADALRDVRPDVAVLLPNSFEAALAARYWGARRRVGFDAGGRRWLLTDAPALPSPRLHQVDEYLRLAEHLGAGAPGRTPVLTPAAPEGDLRREARALLDAAGMSHGGRPVVGIHLGAAYGSSKLWPPARVSDLVRELVAAGSEPVLLGPPDSHGAAAAVVDVAPVPSLVGRDTPEVLPALLAEIDVLVGGDTGVTHLAAALGTRVVALFGPTDPVLTAPRGDTAVVRHPVPCAPCFYRHCPIDHPCMTGIRARDVLESVEALSTSSPSRTMSPAAGARP